MNGAGLYRDPDNGNWHTSEGQLVVRALRGTRPTRNDQHTPGPAGLAYYVSSSYRCGLCWACFGECQPHSNDHLRTWREYSQTALLTLDAGGARSVPAPLRGSAEPGTLTPAYGRCPGSAHTAARFHREPTAGYRSAALHIRRAGQPPTVVGPGWNLLATPHALAATAVEGLDTTTASQAFSSWIRAPRSSPPPTPAPTP